MATVRSAPSTDAAHTTSPAATVRRFRRRSTSARTPSGASRDSVAATLSRLAPLGVRALVDRRLNRLTVAAGDVVCAASVLGADLTVAILAAVCDVAPDVTYQALDEGLV